jgi:hypothetical protein
VVLGEVGEVLAVEGGQRQVVGQAASRDPGVVDRAGRPRWVAAADSWPQVAAMARLPGMTGLSASQSSSIARLRGPPCRSRAHWVISPMVTKVRIGCRPTSRAASLGESRLRNEAEATSVSRTTAPAAGSGKVGVP